jgi:hypothetical protein
MAGIGCLVAFMYAYGYYKSYGGDAWLAWRDPAVGNRIAIEAQRGLETTILHDMGRSDIQAFLLYRLTAPESGSNYELVWGRTYLGTLALVVPSRLWPDRPPPKTFEGTEAVFGKSTYTARNFATFAYGLAGETMLNFGPLAVPPAYFLFGLFVGRLRRWANGIRAHDARILAMPFIVSLTLFVLVWDSDVTFYYVITTGLVPLLLIAISSARVKLSGAPEASSQPASLLAQRGAWQVVPG